MRYQAWINKKPYDSEVDLFDLAKHIVDVTGTDWLVTELYKFDEDNTEYACSAFECGLLEGYMEELADKKADESYTLQPIRGY